MSLKKNIIYIKIAGFIFKISFLPETQNFESLDLWNNIIQNYKGFLVKNPKKVDYFIEILYTPLNQTFLTRTRKSKNKFTQHDLLFFEDSPSTLRTVYHISFLQFNFLVLRSLQKLLSLNNGFIIHCSAVNILGKVQFFIGESGAGKSTAMTLLSSKFQPLADDSAVIRYKNGSFYCYQLPFIEKNNWIKKECKKYKIGRIFFLRKSSYFKLKKVDSKEYIFELLIKQLWSLKHDIKLQIRIFTKFIILTNQFYNLYFAKDGKGLIDTLMKNSVDSS